MVVDGPLLDTHTKETLFLILMADGPTSARSQCPMIPPQLNRLLPLGWHVFPVSRQTKRTPFKGAKDAATTDPDIIARWCEEYPGCNWRAHPGYSRILCLDIDRAGNLHEADGFATMQRLTERYGALPDGPRMKTGGSGGCVAFFRHDGQDLRGGPGALGAGVDVSTVRGAACPTLPPSVHQVSGGRYLWYRGRAPWEIDLPPIPQWICDNLKPLPHPAVDPVSVSDDVARRLLGHYAQDIIDAPSGLSNRTLYVKAFKAGELVRAGKINRTEAEQSLYRAALMRKIPAHEAMPTIRSGLRMR